MNKKLLLIIVTIIVTTMISGCTEVMPEENSNLNTENNDGWEKNDPPKQLFTNDFADACNGVMIAGAAEYDSSKNGIHPVYVFEQENENEKYYERSTILPDAWKKPWEQAKETELVACLTVKDPVLNQECDYEDKGQDFTLELYDAKYDVALYEASTGNKIAETVFELTNNECPMMSFFNEPVEKDYPDYEQKLTEFLKEYVQISGVSEPAEIY